MFEGIVAAGIENDQFQACRAFQRALHTVERDCLVFDILVGLQADIDRKQKVLAVHLHAVAGIIDDGDISAGGSVLEVAQCTDHRGAVEIVHRRHHIETRLFERGLH